MQNVTKINYRKNKSWAFSFLYTLLCITIWYSYPILNTWSLCYRPSMKTSRMMSLAQQLYQTALFYTCTNDYAGRSPLFEEDTCTYLRAKPRKTRFLNASLGHIFSEAIEGRFVLGQLCSAGQGRRILLIRISLNKTNICYHPTYNLVVFFVCFLFYKTL